MNIGSMKKRIILQSMTKVADGMGGWTETAKNEMTVWGSIWSISAAETIAANSISMVITHRIRIRYREEVRASWRVKYGDKYYAIVSIINPNIGNRMLELMCKEAAS